MNFSDAVQIIQVSPDSLQIYLPPRYTGGLVYIVFGLLAVALAIKLHQTKFMLFLFSAVALFFLFGGLDLCTYHAHVTLSGKTQTFAYEEKTFYYRTAKTLPLSSLKEAVVRAGSTQNRQLTLLVTSQPQVPLGDGYNSRKNQFEAASAINAFIARNAQQ